MDSVEKRIAKEIGNKIGYRADLILDLIHDAKHFPGSPLVSALWDALLLASERSWGGGVGAIAVERERQMSVEGWTPEHDAQHDQGELGAAAIAYIASALGIECKTKTIPGDANCGCRSAGECTHYLDDPKWGDPWPWSEEWDKRGKHDNLRKLQIAGALVAAEIDRLTLPALPSEGE